MDFEVVVVGGGLAGLSAALGSARLGRSTAILTGGVVGGQLVSIEHIDGVPGFAEPPPGYDLCPIAQEQADAAGVRFLMATCDGLAREGERWRVASSEGELMAGAVILATGASFVRLGVPGEERLAGRGVSDCASCDGPLLRNKVTVVVGGGDSGMQEALSLAQHAAKVILVEHRDGLSGQVVYREQVEANPKIEVRCGTTVTEILGEAAVTGVRIRELASGAETELETAAVFPFVGLQPNSELVRELAPLDATGRVEVDAALRTSVRGLFAAGNVRGGSPHRAAGAMGDGAAAAVAADAYLATGAWPA